MSCSDVASNPFGPTNCPSARSTSAQACSCSASLSLTMSSRRGSGPPRVLHGLGEGWEAPPSGNRVDGYLPEACHSVGVLQNAGSTQPELTESLWRWRREAAHTKHDRVRD